MFHLVHLLRTEAWDTACQLQRDKGGTKIYRSFSGGEGTKQKTNKQKHPSSQNIKRLLLIEENQTSQVNEFSTFLSSGGYKSLGSLKLFL